MNGNRPYLPERVNLKAAVTVQAPTGLVCGNSLWLVGSQIAIAVDALLTAGDALELRIDLGGLFGTARLRVGVLKQLTTAPTEMQRFIVEMFEVAAEDRRRFDAWVAQLEGSTVSNVDLITRTSDVFGVRVEQASAAERALALQRMDRHAAGPASNLPGASRSGGHPSGQRSSTITDPFGLKSDVGGSTGDRRVAMRDALRQAAQRRGTPTRPSPRPADPTPPDGTPCTDPRSTDPRSTDSRSTDSRSTATDPGSTGPRSTDPRSTDPRSSATRPPSAEQRLTLSVTGATRSGSVRLPVNPGRNVNSDPALRVREFVTPRDVRDGEEPPPPPAPLVSPPPEPELRPVASPPRPAAPSAQGFPPFRPADPRPSNRRPTLPPTDGSPRVPVSAETRYGVPTAARRPTHTVDPTWRVVPGATPCLEIRWLNHDVWRSDVSQQVVNYILMLTASGGPLPDAAPLDVRLLHANTDVRCPATVLSHGPRGATYRLLLESPQVEALRKASA